MKFIRTYDFKYLNLDYISCLSYYEINNPKHGIIGYKIISENSAGDAILVGCLVDEDDVIDCIDQIINRVNIVFDLCSEQEILKIHEKKSKKTKK